MAPDGFETFARLDGARLHPVQRVSSDADERRQAARSHLGAVCATCVSRVCALFHVELSWVRDQVESLIAERKWVVAHEGRDGRFPIITRRPVAHTDTDWVRTSRDAVETGIDHQFALGLLDTIFPRWDRYDPSDPRQRAHRRAIRLTFRMAIHDVLIAELAPAYLPFVQMNGSAVLLILRDVFRSVPPLLPGFLHHHFVRAQRAAGTLDDQYVDPLAEQAPRRLLRRR